MNLYMATMCRIYLDPVRTKYQRALVHAKTPQMAGKMLKRTYPEWERVEWRVLSNNPILIALP